jgi:hypothetical protein
VPSSLQQQPVDETLALPEEETTFVDNHGMSKAKERKSLKTFMDSFKNGLIDLFKEEGDAQL